MLELAKVYNNTIYVYLSADKRYEYNVSVQSEPENKTRQVVVIIYDHKYKCDDINHQPQSCTAFTCHKYSADLMLRRCQYLFDALGLYRNGICTFSDLVGIQCLAKEK